MVELQASSDAIRAVATAFFAALDRFEDGRILELVAEDIEWVRPGGAVRGRDRVRDMLAERPRGRVTRHLITNIVVSMQSAESAQVRYDVLVFDSGAGPVSDPPAIVSGASVLLSGEDEFVLRSDRWQIRRKHALPVFKFNP